MSEPSSQDPKDQPLSNPIDLSDLQSFSFGTQWSDAGQSSKGEAKPGSREPRRGQRQDRRPGGGPPRRDRRPKRPAASRSDSRAQHSHDRRDSYSRGGGDRGERSGGYRRQGGDRPQRPFQEIPYESEIFEVGFYPEDNAFSTVIKAMRANHLTYELFEIAKTFLLKPERFIASVKRKSQGGDKAEKVFISLPDSMPFASEDEAILHAATHHIETFFDTEEVEVDPPSGNFQFVNRCSITKTLLGPPNYHRYEETLKHHHRSRLANMSLEKVKASVETVREQEVIDEWLESMKKTTRYATKPVEGEETQSFDSFDDALTYLKTSHRAKLVKEVNYARVDGKTLENYKDTEGHKAVFGELARQQRFPLETANAIRGRLRREKFSIYKKGSKGVTFVCSTKRNFRSAGQVMSKPLDRIIRFVEANPSAKAKELPPKFEAWLKEDDPEAKFDEKQLITDLHWLIADGYISHFGDDTLFAQPVLDNTPKPKEKKPDSEDSKDSSPPSAVAASELNPEAQETEAQPSSEAVAAPTNLEAEPKAKPSEAEAKPVEESEASSEPTTLSSESDVESSAPAVETAEAAPDPENPAEEAVVVAESPESGEEAQDEKTEEASAPESTLESQSSENATTDVEAGEPIALAMSSNDSSDTEDSANGSDPVVVESVEVAESDSVDSEEIEEKEKAKTEA